MSIPTSSATKAEQYDLTATLSKYLDKHFIFSLLEFLQEKKIHNTSDVLKAKVELAAKTRMVDFHAGEYAQLHGSEPADIEQRRQSVYQELADAATAVQPLMNLIDNSEVADELIKASNFTADYLYTHHQITREHIEALYTYARLNFDCGRYRESADLLFYYKFLCVEEEKSFQAQWGKLASEILIMNSEAAYLDLIALKEAIDQRVHVPPMQQLQQRAWLAHWALFIFFNLPTDGRLKMIEFYLQDHRMLNTIQTACPHLLRYLTVAVVINRKRKNVLKDLTRVLQVEQESKKQQAQSTSNAVVSVDPIISFLLTVYQDFNFEGAHSWLEDCELVLNNDYFLSFSGPEFMEHARLLLFEAYCRIHKAIDITTLVNNLDLNKPNVFPLRKDEEKSEDGSSSSSELSPEAQIEGKIVELIRIARVDAKIDTQHNRIVMAPESPSIYQQIIDKTKHVPYRSQQLVNTVEKKYANRNATE